jgi:VanZ family protein
VSRLEENRLHCIVTKGAQWLWTWGFVAAWCALIFSLSAQPDLKLPDSLPSFSDKIAHFSMYAVLGWLWSHAVRVNQLRWMALTVLLSTCAFTGIYGLSDEWHQLYVHGRSAELRDALADVCGGTFGGIGFFLWLRRRENGKARAEVPEQLRDPLDPAA